MRSSIFNVGLAAIIGLVIGLLLRPPPPVAVTPAQTTVNTPPPPARMEHSSAQDEASLDKLAALSRQLQQEVSARTSLQDKVKKLDRRLTALIEGGGTDAEKAGPSATETPALPHTTSQANRAWFNPQALIDAGVDANTAQALKARYEKQELDRLYLRDQAVREGWFGSRRYREAVKKIDSQLSDLQTELGDEAYAAYLYATGQSNRVSVQSILAGSAADLAGLQSDDQILRYGDKRIYSWRDLRSATTEGDVSETVPLKIVRDGKPMTLYVQRGPLGIRMSSISVAP